MNIILFGVITVLSLMGAWLKTRGEMWDEVSDKYPMFCVCGRLCTGLHVPLTPCEEKCCYMFDGDRWCNEGCLYYCDKVKEMERICPEMKELGK